MGAGRPEARVLVYGDGPTDVWCYGSDCLGLLDWGDRGFGHLR